MDPKLSKYYFKEAFEEYLESHGLNPDLAE